MISWDKKEFIEAILNAQFTSTNNTFNVFPMFNFTKVKKESIDNTNSKTNFITINNEDKYYFKHSNIKEDTITFKVKSNDMSNLPLACFRLRNGLLYLFNSWEKTQTWEDANHIIDYWNIHEYWKSTCEELIPLICTRIGESYCDELLDTNYNYINNENDI